MAASLKLKTPQNSWGAKNSYAFRKMAWTMNPPCDPNTLSNYNTFIITKTTANFEIDLVMGMSSTQRTRSAPADETSALRDPTSLTTSSHSLLEYHTIPQINHRWFDTKRAKKKAKANP